MVTAPVHPLPADRSALAAESLLDLADPLPRLAARLRDEPAERLAPVLHALADALRERPHPLFRLVPVDLRLPEGRVRLDLLALPSIFPPDDEWSVAFLRGLLRKPRQAFHDKRMIELGCGSGWISLALLTLTDLRSVLGVDLNPQAVLVSRLNAVLNGYDSLGRPRPGRLAERYDAVASDLLTEPRLSGRRADLVIGCIPQVATAELDLGTEQGPYDLCNYALPQGLSEDRYGLGLNSRALAEAAELLDPGGSVVLNLAGRPGAAVLRRMFRRHGYTSATLHTARVRQAADTDITPLAELESGSGHPCAFYLERDAAEPVPATTARAVLANGRPVYHDLHVMEGHRPARRSNAVPRARSADTPHRSGHGAWSLSRLAARFAAHLADAPFSPYPHEAGSARLRSRLATVLQSHHSLPLAPAEIFAAPGRVDLLHAVLLTLTTPGDTVALTEGVRPRLSAAVRKAGLTAVHLPADPVEAARRLPSLDARVVVATGADPRLARLLTACEDTDALLLVDAPALLATGLLATGAETVGNASLRLLRDHPASGHLAVLTEAGPAGLALGLLLSRDRRLLDHLEIAAELTWSRVSQVAEFALLTLVDGLLARPSAADGPGGVLPTDSAPPPPARPGPPPGPTAREAAAHPAFARPAPAAGTIRLDYGENELPLPPALRSAMVHGVLRARSASGEAEARRDRAAVAGYLRATRLPEVTAAQVTLGAGSLPLLFDALRARHRTLGRGPVVLLPQGSYGLFGPLVRAAGGTVRTLPAVPPDFLATPEALAAAGPFDVLLLTSPGNPTGVHVPPAVLRSLVAAASACDAKVILDEVFGLLADLDGPLPLGGDRWAGLSPAERRALLLVGGLSKEFAAGGLRLGFAATADPEWSGALRAQRLSPLPPHLRITATRLFADLPALWPELKSLRAELASHRAQLSDCLRELGFGLPDGPRGGLFLHPDVAPLTSDPDAFVLALEQQAGVRLNTPSWSGTASRARACFALPEHHLAEALHRLRGHLG
ncbi:aminotransferase class I/II-fold pyridoxal phosphate-dependent enzyme [Kitasatospora sp. NPDC049285]|uniref:aminotransferase class I/II-fold pyridoxal phosphate-dependent enzyme n=1 Tax=Kitasatospora sp. NPDC049285 TaxID=3157096 RepID=UPI00342F3219